MGPLSNLGGLQVIRTSDEILGLGSKNLSGTNFGEPRRGAPGRAVAAALGPRRSSFLPRLLAWLAAVRLARSGASRKALASPRRATLNDILTGPFFVVCPEGLSTAQNADTVRLCLRGRAVSLSLDRGQSGPHTTVNSHRCPAYGKPGTMNFRRVYVANVLCPSRTRVPKNDLSAGEGYRCQIESQYWDSIAG